MLLLNARSISPATTGVSRWKIPYINKFILSDKSLPPAIAVVITETWLNDHITDAQILIPCYVPYRADRKNSTGGGAIIYLHNGITATETDSYSDIYNSMVYVYVESLHTLLFAVYRPPDSPDLEFGRITSIIQDKIDCLSRDNVTRNIYIYIYHR